MNTIHNLFPLPVREQADPTFRVRDPYASSRPPALPVPPLVRVPPASLPDAGAQPSADSEKPEGR
ncbi:MAG: hypothetical protein HOQ22_07230 [Nocardioidaceae bacterium]|nr:hypothetical protein [Nocardioidaceae bacterium]NUS50818.1 hypothetical protein [Nocardioidaceae bacterium]